MIAPESRPVARPRLLLGSWAAVLVVLAGLMPLAQTALGVPWELVSLIMVAPALASLVAVARQTWLPRGWVSADMSRVLGIALIAVGLVGVFALSLGLLTGRAPTALTPVAGVPVAGFVAVQALGALGEEIGWRGVVQRCGEALARPWLVSAIAGFVFGITHIGYWGLGPVPVLVFALAAMCMSLAITSIHRGSFWQRMIPATVVHLGVNLTVGAFMVGDEPLATRLPALAAAAIMAACAAGIGMVIGRRAGDTVEPHTTVTAPAGELATPAVTRPEAR